MLLEEWKEVVNVNDEIEILELKIMSVSFGTGGQMGRKLLRGRGTAGSSSEVLKGDRFSKPGLQ